MPYGNKRHGVPIPARLHAARPLIVKGAEAQRPRPSKSRQEENSRRIALLAAQAGLEKKAEAVEIIEVGGKVDYADYIVLMTGRSDRNVVAIADAVEGLLAQHGVRSIACEGLPLASWVLIDFVDVVVHVFQQDARAVYNLDGLWMDAHRVAPAEYEALPVAPSPSVA